MKMYKKIIPETDEKNYISGWEALNIPDEKGNVADWHPKSYLFSNIPDEKISLYNTINILGNKGISQRVIDYPERKKVYIANFPRAIADLLITMPDYEFSSLYKCREDFLTEEESEELYGYLSVVKERKRIDDFLKYEFTDKYFGQEEKYGDMAK